MKNKLKLNAALTTVAVLVCVILLNLIVQVISEKKPIKLDMTRERIYEFSDQTKSAMEQLSSEVDVYALIPESLSNKYIDYVREYLSKYSALSDQFKVSYIDPYNDPSFVKKYESNGDTIEVGSIIVTCGDKFKVVSFNDLYSQTQTNAVYIDMERKITGAVIQVTGSGNKMNILFTEGHSEDACSNLTELFKNEGYSCNTVNLSSASIGDDTSLLVIAAPTKDFTAAEIDAIDNYADKGGDILFLAPQPGMEIPSTLAKYLADWGITIENDYVIESNATRAYRSPYGGTIPAPEMQSCDFTDNLIKQKISFLAPIPRSITVNENNTYSAQIQSILKTSSDSWGKVDLSAQSAEYAEGDHKGPLDVGVLTVRYNSENQAANMLVLGSLAAVETDGILTQSNYANGDFMLNSVAYMTESSSALDIHPKSVSDSMLTITQAQATVVSILVLVVLPLLIIAAGVVVFIRRRNL